MNPVDLAEVFESAVPWWHVISLRNRFYLRNFVETGTGYGDTAYIASTKFKKVYTIDINPDVYENQRPWLKAATNVFRFLGDSVVQLPSILSTLDAPTFFYLDGHWTGQQKPQPDCECPLLEELALICSRPQVARDVIMIDNWGMMKHPPNPPHAPAKWPKAHQVIEAILSRCGLCVMEYLDTLIATPESVIAEHKG